MNTQSQVAAKRAAGAAGPGLATEQGPIDVFSEAWHVVEKGVMVEPTFTITIKARHSIVVSGRDIEVEIDRFGLSLRAGDEELTIDPRYNSAELRKSGKLIAISDRVRYRWIHRPDVKVYEAKDFAELVKKSVKELIEEAAATAGL
jgi:hypothetical protein